MDAESTAKIHLLKSREDWKHIRECFVNSFNRYPLYKYMIPDPNKRDAFLRAYLDANYDVTVGSGEGFLVGFKVVENGVNKVVGGVLFVLPSSDGCGWAIGSDEPYWKAYNKHGLGEISAEGLKRVKRYEAWENENICAKLRLTRIPMWNGIFFFIDPQYASKGVGKEHVRMMSSTWPRQTKAPKLTKVGPPNGSTKRSQAVSIDTMDSDEESDKHKKRLYTGETEPQWHKAFTDTLNSDFAARQVSILIAISHSDSAARFHESNGFNSIFRAPFCINTGEVEFYVHVLVLDPFRTGAMAKCKDALGKSLSNQTESIRPASKL